jgi:hypothetical protein
VCIPITSQRGAPKSRQLRSNLRFDTDGDGFSDRSEKGTPLCQDNHNADLGDGRIDDGCPAYGGLRELDVEDARQCENSVNDDGPLDDPFVNDGCPPFGTWSEAEFKIGTDHDAYCPSAAHPDAWPPDINKDGFTDISDISVLTGSFNKHVTEAPPRHNIWPDPLDAYIDITDITRIVGLFGDDCRQLPAAIPDIAFAESTYTGDGSGGRQIDVGFQPKFVMVKADHNYTDDGFHNNSKAVMRSDTMSQARNVTNNGQDQGISELNGTGFKVDFIETTTHGMTNDPDKTYYWWAVGGSGIKTDTYDGNGQNDRQIANIGFEPEMLLVIRPTGGNVIWRTSSMGSEDYDFSISSGETDRTKSLDADGFTLGTDSDVNQAFIPPITYHYVAFKEATNLHVGSYDGNGMAGRDLPILPMSFQPDLVQIKADGGPLAVWKTMSLAGEGSFTYSAGDQDLNQIQSLAPAPGQFEVGSAARVNSNVLSYYFFAVGTNVPP